MRAGVKGEDVQGIVRESSPTFPSCVCVCACVIDAAKNDSAFVNVLMYFIFYSFQCNLIEYVIQRTKSILYVFDHYLIIIVKIFFRWGEWNPIVTHEGQGSSIYRQYPYICFVFWLGCCDHAQTHKHTHKHIGLNVIIRRHVHKNFAYIYIYIVSAILS